MSEPSSEAEEETITIYELLERSAESALELQREDGSFPPGRNYTYDEPETPVRTTSHWTVTLSEVYEITGKEKFREAADAAVDYLLSREIRPHGYTYYCRDAPGKDHCNGLVGQAGPIRALAHAGPILERQDAIDTAKEVFMIHPFDSDLGLWERVETDGKKLSFDRTLNHQILFAAATSQLADGFPPAKKRIHTFLDNLDTNMNIHPNGLIKHYVRPRPLNAVKKTIQAPRHYHLLINEIAYHCYAHSQERKKKERGYQTVNLSGLTHIKREFDHHNIWNSDVIHRSIEFLKANQKDLIEKRNTKHGSVMTGTSIARILHTFEDQSYREMIDIIRHELIDNLDESTYLLTSDEINENNKTSMILGLVYLPNLEIPMK